MSEKRDTHVAELVEGMTMPEAFVNSVAAYGERDAVVLGDQRVTFAELGQRVDALAAGLDNLGLRKGDNVVLLLPNCLEFIYLYWGLGKVGAVFVPMNPLFRRREIGHVLADSEAAAVVFAPKVMGNDLWGIIKSLRDDLPNLRYAIAIGDDVPEGATAFNGLLAQAESAPPEGLAEPDDLFGLFYTSGTTGMPKGAMHTQRAQIVQAIAARRIVRAQTEKPLAEKLKTMVGLTLRYGTRYIRHGKKPRVSLMLLPMHTTGGHAALRSAVVDGMPYIALERFHPIRALEIIERERVNMVAATPSMFRMMLDVEDFDRYDKSSLLIVYSGAAYIPPKLAEQVEKRFNCPVLIGYGATETSVMTATGIRDRKDIATETVGRPPSDSIQVRVVGNDRNELPVGDVGEIAVKLPGMMLGYYKAPELTAEVLDDEGWYYTGDLGTMDAEGNFSIVGRTKDMIIRGGQNIYPAEIEDFILTHPSVNSVAVVGVPAEAGSENVWAFVIPHEGKSLTEQDVLRHCRGQIAAYKVPSEVRIVDALPMNPMMKVQKFKLREAAKAEIAG